MQEEHKVLKLLSGTFSLDNFIINCFGGKCRFSKWNPLTGEEKTLFHGKKDVCDAFIISESEQIATLSVDGYLRVYNLETGEEVQGRKMKLKGPGDEGKNPIFYKHWRISDNQVLILNRYNSYYTSEALLLDTTTFAFKKFNVTGDILHREPISGKFFTSYEIIDIATVTSKSSGILATSNICKLDDERVALAMHDINQSVNIVNISRGKPRTERRIPILGYDQNLTVECMGSLILISSEGQPRIQVFNWKSGELVCAGGGIAPHAIKKIYPVNKNHFVYISSAENKYQVWRWSPASEEKFELRYECQTNQGEYLTFSAIPYLDNTWLISRNKGVFLCSENNLEGVKMPRQDSERVTRLRYPLILTSTSPWAVKTFRIVLMRRLKDFLPKDLVLETFKFFLT